MLAVLNHTTRFRELISSLLFEGIRRRSAVDLDHVVENAEDDEMYL